MRFTATLVASASLLGLAACEDLDSDFRGFGGGFNTTSAAQKATEPRPAPDDRGILSYPGYQVAVARRGDTVSTVAARIGLPESELAARNSVPPGAPLNAGSVLLLPRRVAEPSPATGAIATGPIRPAEQVDVAVLADTAISRAEDRTGGTITPAQPATPARAPQTGQEPIRHVVKSGETAYSVSRLYGVSVQALDDWNGLDDKLTLRIGQTLLIPPEAPSRPSQATVTRPGAGSATPTPPSAATPLPKDEPAAAQTQTSQAKPAPGTPASPDLGKQATQASASKARFSTPVQGNIIRAFSAKSDGIDIGAPAGTAVKAADAGTVAAITQSTDKVPILVLRHSGGLLTVYANVDGLTVAKGDKVSKGQTIAKVRSGNPSFLHFEVRDGLKAVDPAQYLP
ncbi:peptidoglycan DD-metalloendopeptidase family protein [Vannielia litorea]|uniref:Murein DD-endopeptidase MepM and murein hydrolase activator NlpD, contain LysM domain n=1 Tax=Vannielia litorea TaxID=1217970 RepID=A0A1N6FKU6_9RHOB|nr:M23 family metallopeptidase [Vannielia litorea]SIN95871.1 Murein DD-endopeptidase MepM and murein hydrolase activator NlpD, contain LysM domain [Vannielia litorea]